MVFPPLLVYKPSLATPTPPHLKMLFLIIARRVTPQQMMKRTRMAIILPLMRMVSCKRRFADVDVVGHVLIGDMVTEVSIEEEDVVVTEVLTEVTVAAEVDTEAEIEEVRVDLVAFFIDLHCVINRTPWWTRWR